MSNMPILLLAVVMSASFSSVKGAGIRLPKKEATSHEYPNDPARVVHEGQNEQAVSQDQNGVVKLLAQTDVQEPTTKWEDWVTKMVRFKGNRISKKIPSRREAEKMMLDSAAQISDAQADTVIKHYLGRTISDMEAQSMVVQYLQQLERNDEQRMRLHSEDLISKAVARRIVGRSKGLSQLDARHLLSKSAGMLSEGEAQMIIKHYLGRVLSKREAEKILHEVMHLLGRRDAKRLAWHTQDLSSKIAAHRIVSRSRNILNRPGVKHAIMKSARTMSSLEAKMILKQHFGRVPSESEANQILTHSWSLLEHDDSTEWPLLESP